MKKGEEMRQINLPELQLLKKKFILKRQLNTYFADVCFQNKYYYSIEPK
jgi:hypothetical protein